MKKDSKQDELMDFLIGDKTRMLENFNKNLDDVNAKRKLIIDKMAEIDILFGEIYDGTGNLSNLCLDIVLKNIGML